jgi:hypothetical protein
MCQINTEVMKKQIGCIDVLSKFLEIHKILINGRLIAFNGQVYMKLNCDCDCRLTEFFVMTSQSRTLGAV